MVEDGTLMGPRAPAPGLEPGGDSVVQVSHGNPELDPPRAIAQPGAMALSPSQPLTHGAVLRIAVPIMLSNVSEPLIGVVNAAVVGQLPDASLIGGVSIGGVIFAFLFWGFGFLRLSTSGMSAQATGAGDQDALAAIIWRSLIIGVVIGAALLLLSPLIGPFAISLMGGSAAVQEAVSTYFSFRIWSAPAALANFAILGWFIGQSRAGTAFFIQLLLNVTNMVLSVVLVLELHMGVAGTGLAAIISEYVAVVVGLVLILQRLRQLGARFDRMTVFEPTGFSRLISANSDIMIRTLCLLFAFSWMASRGARQGDTIIAANSILLHFFDVAAYLIDGFAYAAEALVGQAIGARKRERYGRAIRLSTLWAMAFGLLTSAIIFFGGGTLIDLMTVNEEVRTTARVYLPLAAATPFLGAACFLYDGIFTGAMATREMRNMMVLSLAIYLASSQVLEGLYGNHGLWIAFCIFFIARGVSFAACLKSLERKAFQSA
jgi:MATE family multidrug resistance protein